jgi:hypothetical protein
LVFGIIRRTSLTGCLCAFSHTLAPFLLTRIFDMKYRATRINLHKSAHNHRRKLMKLKSKLVVLLLMLISFLAFSQGPSRANTSCQRTCLKTYTTCAAQAQSKYQACMVDANNAHEACLANCDLYPQWTGCPDYCANNYGAQSMYCSSVLDSEIAACEEANAICQSNCP